MNKKDIVKRTEISSEVQKVTVYQSQARVSRTIKAEIVAGKQQLVLTGLPNGLDHNTTQVRGKGDFMLLGIRHEMVETERENFTEDLEQLALEITKIDQELSGLEDKIYLLDQEEEFLKVNRKIVGEQSGVSLENMKELSVFVNQGFSKVVNNRQKILKKKQELKKQKDRMEARFTKMLEDFKENSLQLILEVESDKKSKAEFTVEYMMRNCGWYPKYDLRADSEDQSLMITYVANVYQFTSEKWENISLVISSGDPSANNTKPILRPWTISSEPPLLAGAGGESLKISMSRAEKPLMKKATVERFAEEENAYSVESLTETTETAINISYEIDSKYTIPRETESVSINLQEFRPKADFKYIGVPKLDRCGFLIATVKEWDTGDLIPGKMHIYLDKAFVGETYLNTRTTEEELILSLGRDERIAIAREQQKHQKTSASLIGNKKKQVFSYLLKMKNNLGGEVEVAIEDNIPISEESEIQVKIIDIAEAQLDESKGILTWQVNLSPGESTEIKYQYEVVYHKERPPVGL